MQMCSGSSSPFTETSRRRSDKHSTGLFVRLAPAKARGTNTVLPQTTRTKNSLLEYKPSPSLSPSIPIRLFKRGMLQMLFQMGTEKQFLNQHILIHKNIFIYSFLYKQKVLQEKNTMTLGTEKNKLLKSHSGNR